MKKYEILNEYMEIDGHQLHRIRALIDFADVVAGDLGGFIDASSYLSQTGDAWIYNNSKVFDDSVVMDSVIRNNSTIRNSKIMGASFVINSVVRNNTTITDNSVLLDSTVSLGYTVYGLRANNENWMDIDF